MKISHANKGFTLIELLATIAIMAVLIVAALPYVADYTSWARSTAEIQDAQVVSGAIARWIAVGGNVTGLSTGADRGWLNLADWRGCTYGTTFRGAHRAANIIRDLVAGWTVVPTGNKDPFLAPNTSYTVLGSRIKIAFTSSRNYTVTGRSR